MSKVIDLHPDRPTPKKVLDFVAEKIEDVDAVLVIVLEKNGDVWDARSSMSTAEACLLSKYLDKRIDDEIDGTIDDGEEE